MKKVLMFILALTMALSLAACGNHEMEYKSMPSAAKKDSELAEGYLEVFQKYFTLEFSVVDYERTGEYTAEAKVSVIASPKIPNPADESIKSIDVDHISFSYADGAIGMGWKKASVKLSPVGAGYFATFTIKQDVETYASIGMTAKDALSDMDKAGIEGRCRSEGIIDYLFTTHF